MDSNPAWIPDKPFRFMELPAEIRLEVYSHMFEGTVLEPCRGLLRRNDPCIIPRVAKVETPAFETVYSSGDLPDVLLVSKAVRNEALPIFSKSLAAVFMGGDERNAARIPRHYLRDLKVAIVQAWFRDQINEIVLPNLSKMIIYNDVGGELMFLENYGKEDAGFMLRFNEDVKLWRDFYKVLDLRIEQGHVPFEVKLIVSFGEEDEESDTKHAIVCDYLQDKVLCNRLGMDTTIMP